MSEPIKLVKFMGTALDDLRSFPASARQEAGFQLYRVQQDGEANDWKPMNTVGPGVREIRIRDDDGAFRLVYVAKFEEAIYVLHCFQKKSQRTNKGDLDLTTRRFKDLMEQRR